MPVELAILKPVVEAIMTLIKFGNNVHLAKSAEKQIREAIKDLFLANPDENKVEAALAAAKAANLLTPEVIFAGQMLEKVRRHKKVATRKKAASAGAATKRAAKGKLAKKMGAKKSRGKKAGVRRRFQ